MSHHIDIDPILQGLRYAQKALSDASKYGLTLAKSLTPNWDGDDKVAVVLGQAADLAGVILADEQLISLIRLIVGDHEVATFREEARTARIHALLAAHAPAGASLSPELFALIVRFVLAFLNKR